MKTQTRRAHLSIEERSFIMSERLRGSNENINGLTPVSAQRHGPQPGVTAHAQPHLLAFEYPPACRTQFPKSTLGLQPNDRKNPKRSNLTYCCT